ncbi:dTMP kinase [Corynebacterium propinquum]|uniref:dTMP kinase n=1 Tax=Corynebacterium propinquum TaxID=43769 RepID=UPI00253F9BA1|nr:dTMP kinase [Corynebacterium propinquum]MDK4258271.1 dTMP kinase [Corynebacterium propinquum]MDK4281584.1 dTMP kinase [Corynebacterium propinquum]MDK4298961.1 dTMP kinase [Corynebacterium propinquum]
MIIAIEGIDGAGKNTVVTALTKTLRQQGIAVEVLAFPDYDNSIHAQLAREALYGRMGDLSDSPYAMATLFALDRAASRDTLWQYHADAADNARHSDAVLILDRYVASSAAYSWARTGEQAVTDWVAELEFGRLGLPKPDLQILLDVPVDVAAARAQSRSEADATRQRDHYERDSDLQTNTNAAYHQLAELNWASQWLVSDDIDKIMATIHTRRAELAHRSVPVTPPPEDEYDDGSNHSGS